MQGRSRSVRNSRRRDKVEIAPTRTDVCGSKLKLKIQGRVLMELTGGCPRVFKARVGNTYENRRRVVELWPLH